MQARLEQPLSGGGPYNPRQELLGLLLKEPDGARDFAIIAELVSVELAGYLRSRLPVPVLSLGSGADTHAIYQASADVVGFKRGCHAPWLRSGCNVERQ